MKVNYVITENIVNTFNQIKNNQINSKISELNQLNLPTESINIIHIFIDKNYFFNSIDRFIADIKTFLGRFIKIYFLSGDKIIEHIDTVFVCDLNIEIIKYVVNVEKEIGSLLISKQKLKKYLKKRKIKKCVFYCWKPFNIRNNCLY